MSFVNYVEAVFVDAEEYKFHEFRDSKCSFCGGRHCRQSRYSNREHWRGSLFDRGISGDCVSAIGGKDKGEIYEADVDAQHDEGLRHSLTSFGASIHFRVAA